MRRLMVPWIVDIMGTSVLCSIHNIGMDGPHVYNRDGWSPCVQ